MCLWVCSYNGILLWTTSKNNFSDSFWFSGSLFNWAAAQSMGWTSVGLLWVIVDFSTLHWVSLTWLARSSGQQSWLEPVRTVRECRKTLSARKVRSFNRHFSNRRPLITILIERRIPLNVVERTSELFMRELAIWTKRLNAISLGFERTSRCMVVDT